MSMDVEIFLTSHESIIRVWKVRIFNKCLILFYRSRLIEGAANFFYVGLTLEANVVKGNLVKTKVSNL